MSNTLLPLSHKNRPVIARCKLYVAMVAASQFMAVGYAFGAPEGGQVVGGTGTIDQTGKDTVINQQTDRLAIDWKNFNVNADERVKFVQPSSSSLALNRVLSHNGSTILGRIDANGQVLLVNPNGVVFGKDSQINVGGMIASGLSVSPTEFMNGNFTLSALEGSEGKVINSGIINASTGGSVTLLGKEVKNEGLIMASLGSVTLAAGKEAIVTFDSQGLVGLKVTKAVLQSELGVDAAVINSGDIQAQGGKVLITAAVSQDIFSQAVNHKGMNAATSVVVNEDGSFILGEGADVVNTGKINASVAAGDAGQVVVLGNNITNSGQVIADSASGTGGHIELHSTDKTEITENGSVSAQSADAGKGGDVKILGNKVGLLDSANVNASGANGGGQILIGGDQTGKNIHIRNADFIYLSENSNVKTDATQNGDGGKLITFASDTARIYGNLSARGEQEGGNGGFIETSGLKGFEILNTPDITANAGHGGSWLIDPYDITIKNQSTTIGGTAPNYEATSSTSVLRDSTLLNALSNNSTVTISTGRGTGTGSISVENALVFTAGAQNSTLILESDGDINIKSDITVSGDHRLNLDLRANYGYLHPTTAGDFTKGYLAAGTGKILIDNGIGGNLTIATGGGYFKAHAASFDSSDALINTSSNYSGSTNAFKQFGAGDITIDTTNIGTGNHDVDIGGLSFTFLKTSSNAEAINFYQIATIDVKSGGNLTLGNNTFNSINFSDTGSRSNTHTVADMDAFQIAASHLQAADKGNSKFTLSAENDITLDAELYDQFPGDYRDATDVSFVSTNGKVVLNKNVYTGGGNFTLSSLQNSALLDLSANTISTYNGYGGGGAISIESKGSIDIGTINFSHDNWTASATKFELLRLGSASITSKVGTVRLLNDVDFANSGKSDDFGQKIYSGNLLDNSNTFLTVDAKSIVVNGKIYSATVSTVGTDSLDILLHSRDGSINLNNDIYTASGNFTILNEDSLSSPLNLSGHLVSTYGAYGGGDISITADGSLTLGAVDFHFYYLNAHTNKGDSDPTNRVLQRVGSLTINSGGDVVIAHDLNFNDTGKRTETGENAYAGSLLDNQETELNITANGNITISNLISRVKYGDGRDALNIKLIADNDKLGGGGVFISNDIYTSGGNFEASGATFNSSNHIINADRANSNVDNVNSTTGRTDASDNGYAAYSNGGSITITAASSVDLGSIVTDRSAYYQPDHTGLPHQNDQISYQNKVVGDLTVKKRDVGDTVTVSQSTSAVINVFGSTSFDLGSNVMAGTVNLTNAGNVFTGNIAFTNTGNVNLLNSKTTILGDSNIAGTLNLTSGGGISETGAVKATSTTTLSAPTFKINLDNADNQFSSFANLGNISEFTLVNKSDVTLGDISTTGGNIDIKSNVILASNVSISTTGNINIGGTVNSANATLRSLTIAGNTITFGDDVGASKKLGAFFVNATDDFDTSAGKNNFNATSFNVTANNIYANALTALGGAVNLNAAGGNVDVTSIDTHGVVPGVIGNGQAGGNITINSADIALGAINTNGSDANTNGSGGNAGAIAITATDTNTSGTPTITLNGELSASGGQKVGAGTNGTDASINLSLSESATGIGSVNLNFANSTDLTVTGGTGTDKITGLKTVSTWTINGDGATVNILEPKTNSAGKTIKFSKFESLQGGDFGNTFKIIPTVVTPTISLIGGSGTDTIEAANTANAWSLGGALESLNGKVTFSKIENINGNGDVDTFTFSGVARTTPGTIDALGDVDIINVATDANIDFTSFSLFDVLNAEVVNSISGGTLTAKSSTAAVITWDLTAAPAPGTDLGTVSDTNHSVKFTNFSQLIGGDGKDVFNIAGTGKYYKFIDGNGGIANEVNITSALTYSVELAATQGSADLTINNIQNIVASAIAPTPSTLSKLSGSNTWAIAGPNNGTLSDGSITTTFSNFNNLIGGTGSDTFDFSQNNNGSIDGLIDGGGGAGINVIKARTGSANTWKMKGNYSGKLGVTSLLPSYYVEDFQNISVFTGGGPDTMDFSAISTGSVLLSLGNGVAGATGFDTFIGSTHVDSTIVGANTSNNWVIDNPNSGTVGGVRFSNFKNISGGTDIDIFNFSANGSVTGTLDGGSGTGVNTINGKDIQTTWIINGANSGLANYIGGFSQIQNIVGGNDNNTFDFSGVPSASLTSVTGGTGTGKINTLVGRTTASTWQMLGANSGTVSDVSQYVAFTNIQQLTGGSAVGNTLKAVAATTNTNTWIFDSTNTLQLAALTAISFSNFDTVWGGAGDNNFLIKTSFGGNINGGTGANIFTLADATASAKNINGAGSDNTLQGANVATIWTMTDLNAGHDNHSSTATNFSNIQTLIGGTAEDTLIGQNFANQWSVYKTTTAYSSLLNKADVNNTIDIKFTGIEKLQGGSASDSFTLKEAGVAITINGGGGADALSAFAASDWTLSGANLGIVVEQATGSPTVNFSQIKTINGQGADTLTARNQANDWALTGPNSGSVNKASDTSDQIAFTNINGLKGNNIGDTFILNGSGPFTATITGGTNTTANTIKNTAANSTWTLDDSADYSGKINGLAFTNIGVIEGSHSASDSDTIQSGNRVNDWTISNGNSGAIVTNGKSISFSHIQNLLGNIQSDKFTFNNSGSIAGTVDGGSGAINTIVGRNTNSTFIMTSASAGRVKDDVSTLTYATFSNIQTLQGGATGTQTLVASDAINTWDVNTNSGTLTTNSNTLNFSKFNVLQGNSQKDTFTISSAYTGTLKGGAGDDVFYINAAMTGDLFGSDGNDIFNINAVLTGNVLGEVGNDTFNFGTAGQAITIDGGLDTNTLVGRTGVINNWVISSTASNQANGQLNDASNITYVSFNLINNLQGNVDSTSGKGTDTLSGENHASIWTINNENAGAINGVVFSGMKNLLGGSDADTFDFTSNTGSITGSIDGGSETGGNNTIKARNNGANTWEMSGDDSGKLKVTGSPDYYVASFSHIQHQEGSLHGNTIIADYWDLNKNTSNGTVIQGTGSATSHLIGFKSQDNSWTIDAPNSGSISGTAGTFSFTGFQNLVGGDLKDTFTFISSGSVGGKVDGAGGIVNTIQGRDIANTWQMTGSNSGSISNSTTPYAQFENIQILTGGSAADTLIGSAADPLNVSNKVNNIWNANSTNATLNIESNSNQVSFTKIENIQGGATGTNKLISTGSNGAWTLNGAFSGTLSFTSPNLSYSFAKIDTIQGSSDFSDTLVARNQNNNWKISGSNAGSVSEAITTPADEIKFSSIKNITGGTSSDTFNFVGGSISGIVDGGSDVADTNNIIVGAASTSTWTMVNANSGQVAVTNGAGYVNSFTHIQTLQGGASNNDKLIGAGTTNSWQLNSSGINSVTNSAVITNFKNINSLQGGTAGNDTLRGSDLQNTWAINNSNVGIVTASGLTPITFANIANLVGGVDVDNFTLTGSGWISGLIDGNTSNNASGAKDTVNLSALTGPVSVELFNNNSTNLHIQNIEVITAPAASSVTNKLYGASDVNYSWSITGTDSGSVGKTGVATTAENTTQFVNFGTLQGGTADDSFDVSNGNITGGIDGGLGNDYVDYSHRVVNYTISLGGAVQGVTSITGVEGIKGNSYGTLQADNLNNIWTIDDVNKGNIVDSNSKKTLFEGFGVLQGGSLTDQFLFTSNGIINGVVKGGNGLNTFDMSNSLVNQTIRIEGAAAGVTNLFEFTNITASASTKNSLIGTDDASTWNIASNGDGSLVRSGKNTITFKNFNSLTGGAAKDDFVFATVNGLTGIIDGGTGSGSDTVVDTIDVKSLSSLKVSLDSAVSADLKVANIEKIDANPTASSTLIASPIANTWVINQQNAGTLNTKLQFSGFANLTGSDANDVFSFAGVNALLTGLIDGGNGAGTDTLNLQAAGRDITVEIASTPSAAGKIVVNNFEHIDASSSFVNTFVGGNIENNWSIAGANSGVLNRTPTNAGTEFTGFKNLIGNSKDDRFIFTAAGHLDGFVDGAAQDANDVVDLSALANVDVLLGDANGNYRHIEKYIGNNKNSILRGDDNNNVWLVTSNNAGSINGTVLFDGFGTLIAGAGQDQFTLSAGQLTGSIKGGNGNDTFNVTGGTLLGSIDGESGDDSFNVTISSQSAELLKLIGGLDKNTLSLIGGDPSFSATHMAAVKNGGVLRYSANAKTYDLNYSGIASINDSVTAESLTLKGTTGPDTFNLTNGGYNLNNYTTVTYQNKENLVVEGPLVTATANVVNIEGFVSANNTITIKNASVTASSDGLLKSINLVLDGVNAIGTDTNRLQTNIENLTVIANKGGIFVKEQNDLNINSLNTTQLVDIDLAGKLSTLNPIITGDLSIKADGDIVIMPGSELNGILKLNADTHNVTINNAKTTQLGDVIAQNLSVNSVGDIVGNGKLFVGSSSTFDASENILLSNTTHDLFDVTIKNAKNVNLKDVSSFNILGLNASGSVSTESEGIDIKGNVNAASFNINANQGVASISSLIAQTGDISIAAKAIKVTDVLQGANISVNTTGDATLKTVNATNNLIVIADSGITINAKINAADVALTSANKITLKDDVDASANTITVKGAQLDQAGAMTSASDIAFNVTGDSLLSGTITSNKGNITLQTSQGKIQQDGSIISKLGDVDVSADAGSIFMGANAKTIVNGDNKNIHYTAADMKIGLFDAALANVTLNATSGGVMDANDVNTKANNVLAKSLTINAVSGVGTASDPIETSVEKMLINNRHGDINLINDRAVTITGMHSNDGSITFENTKGDVTLDNTGNPTYVKGPDTDSFVAHGTINANYNTGLIKLKVDAGSLYRTGFFDRFNPDIVARDAKIEASESIGKFGNKMVIYVNKIIIGGGDRHSFYNWAFFDAPEDHSLFDSSSNGLQDILAAGGGQLVDVESIKDINPAIFTNVGNYVYDDLAILLPPDQRYDEESEK